MKISFFEAASQLEAICTTVDSADEITEAIEDIFSVSMTTLSESVDRRIAFLEYAESQIEHAKKRRDKWANRAKQFERALERIKTNTIQVMKNAPDLPYRGELGTLKIQKNSQPSVIVDETSLHSDYCNVSYAPNRTRIKEAILDGTEVAGARLEYGEHLKW